MIKNIRREPENPIQIQQIILIAQKYRRQERQITEESRDWHVTNSLN